MKVLVTGGSGFIGTNFIEALQSQGIMISNVDIALPKMAAQRPFWTRLDILDRDSFINHVKQFEPDYIVHFAALTDCDPRLKLDDYRVNIEGTANVIEAVKKCASLKRFVFVSSQFVHQGESLPKHDLDFEPHTLYGETKAMGEKMLRGVPLQASWTIVRPTNIWGPWHIRYPYEFWKVLKEGKYIHPGKEHVVRSYGYVKNVCNQIVQILQSDTKIVDGQVFYVGDEPLDLYDWVNEFSVQLTGRKVRVVSRAIVWPIALLGTMLFKLNIKFPLTLSRYHSMTTDNPAPMEKTIKTFGRPAYELKEGVAETVEWLKKEFAY